MKRRELEQRLWRLGWFLKRHGANHDLWTNGKEVKSVPRHSEIAEGTARNILRIAERYPGRRSE